MGMRFRKSVNLGGGFKINLSKHGVGYSWGTKGFRYTKKSTGGSRTTASIPGTGFSWVSESSAKKKHSSSNHATPTQNQPAQQYQPEKINTYDTQTIENSVATEMVSEGLEEMLAAASELLMSYKIIWAGFWITFVLGLFFQLFWVGSAGLMIFALYYKNRNAINLDYEIDEEYRGIVEEFLNTFIKITQSNKVWRIIGTSKVIDKKYEGGAENLVSRKECKKSTKAVFPFKTTEKVASFATKKETLIFLPDKLLIIQGCKIGALSYTDVDFSISAQNFIETEIVPGDATVVGQTWERVNKSGGPDKRFKDNKQLPICRYGELKLQSTSGLNTIIQFSNISNL